MNLVMRGSVWAIRVFDYRYERSSRPQFARTEGGHDRRFIRATYQTERRFEAERYPGNPLSRSILGRTERATVTEYFPVERL